MSIKASNYKSFGDEAQGFEKIMPINIIICKNNSGKSSLIELISHVISPNERFKNYHKAGKQVQIVITQKIGLEEIQIGFKREASYGNLPGNHFENGRQFENAILSYYYMPDEKKLSRRYQKTS